MLGFWKSFTQMYMERYKANVRYDRDADLAKKYGLVTTLQTKQKNC